MSCLWGGEGATAGEEEEEEERRRRHTSTRQLTYSYLEEKMMVIMSQRTYSYLEPHGEGKWMVSMITN